MNSITVQKRRRRGLRPVFMLWMLMVVMLGVYWGWHTLVPNAEKVVPEYIHKYPVVLHGKVLSVGGRMEGDEVKLPLTAVREALGTDMPIRYEEKSGSIIMTTAHKVVRLRTGALTATVNQKPFELLFAAEQDEGEVYIPITPIRELFGLQADLVEKTGVITLLEAGASIQRAMAGSDGAAVRTDPSIRAPIVELIRPQNKVRIWGEHAGWYIVQGELGHIGYADKSELTLTDMEVIPALKTESPFAAWKVLGKKINMTWEAVYQKHPNPADIGDLQGVNVVSPTWMELLDGSGNIRLNADPAYVKWAHKRNIQVWAMFSNGFEPDRTTAALADYETRLKMVKQLLTYSQMYGLQGINLDFENVYTKDKNNLVQFVRELTPLLHEQGLVVSIDVTPKSGSEMWSAFLDREALGKAVDYMVLMGYDEHWATSPASGSVSSLPWVERSIVRILQEDHVPPDKLVLGMPLYTRIWTEGKSETGERKIKSKAVGMTAVDELIKAKRLKPVMDPKTGQHYVEYNEKGALNRIWLEDGVSIKARVALAKKYGLAGVATWQRGFQKPSIWKTIDEHLNHYP